MSELLIQKSAFVVYLSGPCPDGKFYVGQTADFNRRCRDHKMAVGKCPHFHAAIRRVGWEVMQPRIIAQTDIVEEADRLERLYITKYNALFPNGYNLTLGGRNTLFDPKAKITSFEETPVTEGQITEEAKIRLDSRVCCACGSVIGFQSCHKCGVGLEFSRSVLTHMLSGESGASYVLPEKPSLRKSLRNSDDVDLLISIEKSRLGLRKIDDVLPCVASEFVSRLIPYIQQSLKRDVLVKKSLPTFTLGKFHAFPGKKSDAIVRINVERYLRKHRKELGTNFNVHVDLFARTLKYYGASPTREPIALNVLVEKGATKEELNEAIADARLRAEIEEKGKQESRF